MTIDYDKYELGDVVTDFTKHNSIITSVTFSPDGKYGASAGNDKIVRVWKVETGEEVSQLKGYNDGLFCVAFSPDGSLLASGGREGVVKVFDVKTKKLLLNFTKHTHWIRSLAFSSDSKLILSGGADDTVKIWSSESGEVKFDFTECAKRIMSVAYSSDDRFIMSGGSDNTVKIWDIKTGEVVLDFTEHTDTVYSVAFSPDGKLGMSGSRDKTVKVFDIKTGEIKLDFKGHTEYVQSVAFSPDGKLGMSSSYDKTVKVFDIKTGEIRLSFKRHVEQVNSIAFSPDGKLGMSGSSDGTVKVFSLGDLVSMLPPNKYLLKKNGNIYTITEENLENLENLKEQDLTRETFEEFGFEDLELLLENKKFYTKGVKILSMVDKEVGDSILKISGSKNLFETFPSNEYEIMSMSDKSTDKTTMRLSGFKDLRTLKDCEQGSEILVSADPEREGVPLALPYGYTSPQLVVPSGDIRLKNVGSVKELNLLTVGEVENIRIVYSIDGGKTWLTKIEETPNNRAIKPNTVEVDINNLQEVKEKGMTPSYFNTIDEHWTSDVLKTGFIRFAYYFEIEDIEEVSEVDQLEIKVEMYGMWKALINEEEYDYSYTNEHLTIFLYKDGTHKINYM